MTDTPFKSPSRLGSLSRGLRDLRISPLPVAMAAVVAFAAWAFLSIAGEVREGEIEAFDRALLLWFRDPADLAQPIGPAWLEIAMVDLTTLGGTAVLITLVLSVAGFMLVGGMAGPAAFTVLSIAGGTAFSQLLKWIYDRPRPDLVEHLTVIQTASFPSGHATMATIVYLTLAAMVVRLVDTTAQRAYVMTVAIGICIVVGISRVFLGVHWPSDVLAGWALGAAWACCSWLVVAGLRRLRRREATTSA
jgi:undecaprenyl-diphosphatase